MFQPLQRQVFFDSPQTVSIAQIEDDPLRSELPAALTFSNFFLLGAYISGAGISFKINQQLHGDGSLIAKSRVQRPIKSVGNKQQHRHQTHHNYRRFLPFFVWSPGRIYFRGGRLKVKLNYAEGSCSPVDTGTLRKFLKFQHDQIAGWRNIMRIWGSTESCISGISITRRILRCCLINEIT